MTYRSGQQILAISPADDIAIEMAKEFIRKNGYTSETVKMIKTVGYVAVEAR